MNASATTRRKLGSNPWFEVYLDEDRALVAVVRTETPMPAETGPVALLTSFADVLRGLDVGRYSLLLDFRRGPFRNDPEFETARAQERQGIRGLQARFRRTAYLVRTAIGRLQLRRLTLADHGAEQQVFLDENEALAYLVADEPRALTRPA